MKFTALTLALALGLTFSAQAATPVSHNTAVSHTAAFKSGHAHVIKAADAPVKAKKAKKKKKKAAAPKHHA